MARGPAGALGLMTVVGSIAMAGDGGMLFTVHQSDTRPAQAGVSAPAVSGSGRYVAFVSFAGLVEADTNKVGDIYVLDRVTGRVTLETPPEVSRGGETDRPRLSADGRRLVYESRSQGAAAEEPSLDAVIVIRDRDTGATRPVTNAGHAPNGPSRDAEISADGRVVVFTSAATNLVEGPDANGSGEDIYSFDTTTDRLTRVSVDGSGLQSATGSSFSPSVSSNGRYVAFTSTAPLDPRDKPQPGRPTAYVYLRDVVQGTTTRVSVALNGTAPNGPSHDAAISASGRFVAFVSEASNLVSRDRNDYPDVFLRDIESRTTTLVSRSVSGGSANGPSTSPAIADDGEVVVFQSEASDLICAARCKPENRDINLVADIFVSRKGSAAIEWLSRDSQPWIEPSVMPAADAAGSVVAFSSRHPVDAQDVANDFDLFIWTLAGDRGSRSEAQRPTPNSQLPKTGSARGPQGAVGERH